MPHLIRHLGAAGFARHGSAHLLQRLLEPDAKLSFSQQGEDLIFDSLLGHPQHGCYVDVGCNRPRHISNSYRFYLRGWSGVAIDANVAFGVEWARLRPRDKFFPACVSDEAKDVEFNIFASDELSSLGGERFYDNDEHYRLVRVDRLTTRRLTDILDEAKAPADFSFLSVDVEGHDLEVIRSLDLARYRPKIILVEANGTDLSIGHVAGAHVAQYLATQSYEPVGAIASNLFFRRISA